MVKRNLAKTLLAFLLSCITCSGINAEVFFPENVGDLILAITIANNNGQNDIIDLGNCRYIIDSAYAGSTSGLPAIKPDNLQNTSTHSITIKDGSIAIGLLSGAEVNHFTVNASASLYLENVKLEHGYSATNGGSISNSGFLSLKGVAIFGNSAIGNGGAIYNVGSLVIGDSTFAKNSAANGGAIYNGTNGSIYQLFNATFANNNASASGGAIYVNSASVINSATNNTIASNDAVVDGGGIYIAGGSSSSPVTAAGAINVFISNIVAANSASGTSPNGPDIFVTVAAGSVTAGVLNNPQYNLISSSNGNSISNGVNYNIVAADPGLNILQYNGGQVWTMSLTESSPAINAGYNPIPLKWDARGHGYSRTRSGVTDIGAYELQFCELDTDDDGVCNEFDNCPCNFNPSQHDCNHNGVGDACDPCPCPCPHEPCDDSCGPCPPHPGPGPCPGPGGGPCHRCPHNEDEEMVMDA